MARVTSKTTEVIKVRLFHILAGSIGTSICCGKIGSSGLQACVAHVSLGSTSYFVRSHATKEPSLSDDTLYIRTLFMAGKLAIHLTPLLTVSSLSPKVLPFLLQATHSVEVWSFIFSLTFHHFRQVRSNN